MSLKPLVSDKIQQNLFGFTFEGEYPSGQSWLERFNSDGSTEYLENGILSRGTMEIANDIICFKYADQDQFGGCFQVWKRSANCFDFYVTGSTAPLNAKRFGEQWDARGWRQEEPSTCTAAQIS